MKMIAKVCSTFFLFTLLLSCSSLMQVNNQKYKISMKDIRFIPENFNSLKLGYYQTKMNECSPGYPNKIISINTIVINSPQIIICHKGVEGFTPVIPVCVAYCVSTRRGLKYYHFSAKRLHIKTPNNEVFEGEIVDKTDYGMPPLSPLSPEELQQKREQSIQQAQNYSDDELGDGGFAGANYMNVNLLDYIDMPFVPGKYEVWLSFSGLESNHMIVEIVLEE